MKCNKRIDKAQLLLHELAQLYGVQTTYRDVWGKWRESPRESLIQVLRALGAELDEDKALSGGNRGQQALRAALQARKRVLADRLLEPVLVAWAGRLLFPRQSFTCTEGPPKMNLHEFPGPLKLTLHLEQGEEISREFTGTVAADLGRRSGLVLREKMPPGYHQLTVEGLPRVEHAVVISAPRRCWEPVEPGRGWGLFAPLYALPSLRSGRVMGTGAADRAVEGVVDAGLDLEVDLGVGDLGDLAELCVWVGEAGGEVVATLPLLSLLGKEPIDPSPYRPMSRLFWNELYLALERTPEWTSCTRLHELRSCAALQEEERRLCRAERVDYKRASALKRHLLLEASRWFFARADQARRRAFAAYVREHPEVEDYARFRAQIEAKEADGALFWVEQEARSALLQGNNAASSAPCGSFEELVNLHLYSQWQTEEQLRAISEHPGSAGLVLDLPVGIHPEGYDVQRWPKLFVREVSLGAPPDRFFSAGQDWASPALHPEVSRSEGHAYYAACLRHHMRHARYLRVDHVMSLHRLFWIPKGAEPDQGVYVTYPDDELYAVLSLESHRSQTRIVGEDLGTVPTGVRVRLRRHGILGSWVFQSSLQLSPTSPVRLPSRHVVAYLGTHDMYPWAGFWQGRDLETGVRTGQLVKRAAKRAWARRQRVAVYLERYLAQRQAEILRGSLSVAAPLPAFMSQGLPQTEENALGQWEDKRLRELLLESLRLLAQTEASLVVVGLADLLLETEAQNIPGTGIEYGNWCRRARVSSEELKAAIEELTEVLGARAIQNRRVSEA